ncbi:MAG: hypothetical protein BWY63_00477 [Chloroflexi bacterium ADurb.Bin360]|nr:MAG: hypothetical protein BWY63_00477 [Chloroflexi bacterium ADurb.Bin360]
MSINELDLILKKDPIISTWPARSLITEPDKVEKDYLIHAKTHLSLGDTAKYVDAVFKWVSGANKGTFVGAVLGDYGEGKTSLLVHLWDQSRDAQILTVPPFEWSAFEDIPEAIAAWVQHMLHDVRPDLSRKVQRLHERFCQQTLESLAREQAKRMDKDFDAVLETVRGLIASGGMQLTSMSAAKLLDLVAEISQIAIESGYQGLLILLDEPEVAAKKLGTDTVQHFIFDLANELIRRQGNYGVFLSMPKNFYANAQSRFAALPARLEARGCFPKLSDIYNNTFAKSLWERYITEFDLGEEGRRIASPLALQAIGQVGSSEQSELAYGPRSVVSAFSRMVDVYQSTGKPYEPLDFVRDILNDEIMVIPEYRSKIRAILQSPDVTDDGREAVMLLAAFPSGLQNETLKTLGIEERLRPLARSDGLVRSTMTTMRLRALQTSGEGERASVLADLIQDFDSEYVSGLTAFNNALCAFTDEVLPFVFKDREGHQLEGWKALQQITRVCIVDGEAYLGTYVGAFPQTTSEFPNKAVIVLVNSLDASLRGITMPKLDPEAGPQNFDFLFHFSLRWHVDQPIPAESVTIKEPSSNDKMILVRLYIDLTTGLVEDDRLGGLVGESRLTPLWVLNLLAQMRKVELPREVEAEWIAVKRTVLRRLMGLLFGMEFSQGLISVIQGEFEERLSGTGVDLLGSMANLFLHRRYSDYVTLMRQPHWQRKVDQYINVLSSGEVPLSCKRGREPWCVDGNIAARVLGTSSMNLRDTYVGYESLIRIEGGSRKGTQIQFYIHPLEQEIRDLICAQASVSNGRRLKQDGKDCWYLPITDLLPAILGKGYTVEELGKIIEMGKARQTFSEQIYRRERVLYCMPIDADELRAQLRDKLQALMEEIGAFKEISSYATSFNSAEVSEAIERVQDDVDYEHLAGIMNEEFKRNHRLLPTYFLEVENKLKQVRKQFVGLQQQVASSREAKQIGAPSAQSPWGHALGRYIVQNLEESLKDFKRASEALLGRIDREILQYAFSQQRTPQENLALLHNYWSTTNDLEGEASSQTMSAQHLLQQLAQFYEWRKVLNTSDQVYERLRKLQQEPEHRAKAKEFMADFDQISQEIADHLELRNVSGLAAYRQFEKRFEELEQQRQAYLTNLKASFDSYKDKLNQILAELTLDARVTEVFNPDDIANCYQRLFSNGEEIIHQQAFDRLLEELRVQERELTYAQDVLHVIDAQQSQEQIAQLISTRQAVESLRDELSAEYIRSLIDSDDATQAERLGQAIKEGFSIISATQAILRQVTAPKPPSSEQARHLYSLVPETDIVDFKELILQMISETGNPTHALEASLESLVELFRANCVQVSVKRRKR